MIRNTKIDADRLITSLRGIALFGTFDDQFFPAFAQEITTIECAAGDRIINEGDQGREMFFLISGAVRVHKKTLSGDDYAAAVLKAENGVFFGEMGLLTEDTRSASIISETDAALAKMTAEAFNAFVNKQPRYGAQLAVALATSICLKLKKANKDTIILYEALMSEIGSTNLGVQLWEHARPREPR